MNEIKHIHLGRTSFTVSVEAYKELHEYLEAIKQQVGENQDVVDEVESRMAELLTERGIHSEKVVLPADVQFLKEQLGEPHDFKEEESESPSQRGDEAENQRRLFRDTDNAMIAGVGSGLAAYLGIDPVIIRLLFVALVFAGGSGILLYIVLWLIVPEAKTNSDRLQMRGKAVTVDSLKEVVDRADVPAAAHRARGAVGRVIEGIFKVVLGIFGAILTTVASVTIVWSIMVSILLLTHHGKVAGEVFFPVGNNETWAVITAAASVVIIFLFLLFVGISMIRRKWQLPGWGVAAMFGLLFIMGPIAGALIADSVPDIQHRFDALHHTQRVSTAAFKNLSANGHDTRFIFKPDKQYWLEYKYIGAGDTGLISHHVQGDTLYVDSGKYTDKQLCSGICIYSGPDLQVIIHAPALDQVSVAGSEANFISEQALSQKNMTLDVAEDAFTRIDYATSSKAVLQANGSGTRHLALDFKSQTFAGDEISMDDEGVVHMGHADELDFTTNRICDEGDAYVFLSDSPDKLVVNGKTINSDSNDPSSLRNPDKSTDLNCVDIRAGQLNLKPVVPEPKPVSPPNPASAKI